MDKMTYEEALDFLVQSNRYGSSLGLERITELFSRLGDPQEKLKIVHVAGTNGKGSTAAFITSILAMEGYRVGRYTSPAVFTCRERIQVVHGVETGAEQPEQSQKGTIQEVYEQELPDADNSQELLVTENITESGICDTIPAIQPICDAMVAEGLSHPTIFEVETAMAMLYFCREQVDFAVVEVGMGGRLDATNTIKQPVCSVITSISMDHMRFLGDTLEKIAGEKAGIIKECRPVITCNQPEEVLAVLIHTAAEKNSKLTAADASLADVLSFTPEGTRFRYDGGEYAIRLMGKHQVDNAVLAIFAAREIRRCGYHLSMEAIKQGLWQASWSGRFEVIARRPYFILDGAHNEGAALRLREAIQLYFTGRRLIFVMGVFADKDYRAILRIMAPLAGLIITLTPENTRALPSAELAREAKYQISRYASHSDVQKNCPAVIDGNTAERAVSLAYEMAGEEDVILAFGSLSFLGSIKERVSRLNRVD